MKKRIVSIVLAVILLFCENNARVSAAVSGSVSGSDAVSGVEFDGLNDERLCRYVRDSIYSELVHELNDKEYFVSVQTQYRTMEHLRRLSYNSKSNVYFGFTLEEIRESLGDKKFVFTVDENGKTVYKAVDEAVDDTFKQVLKDVAIGTGVILVCVTASAVTAGVGAPAVSLIFAASAKTGAIMAMSSGALGGVASAIITGIKTNDLSQAVKAGAVAGAEGFKWGAITGAITGGVSESAKCLQAMKSLRGADLKLSMQEAAAIQMESGYPADVISELHSFEEYKAFKKAGLKPFMVNGKTALIRENIDLTFVGEDGLTNLDRMKKGNAPLDALGNPFQLHHVGQEPDGTLAILTADEHKNKALHGFYNRSRIDRAAFDPQKERFWKTVAEMYKNNILAAA